MADLLIKNGANIGAIDFTDSDLQSYLVHEENMVKFLISNSANLNVADSAIASIILYQAVAAGKNARKVQTSKN